MTSSTVPQPVTPPDLTAGTRAVRSESPTRRIFRRTFRNRGALIGAIVLLVLIAASVCAPLLSSQDPNAIDPSLTMKPPSLAHPMGTDHIGRDVFTRFLYGGRLSLWVGVLAILIGATIGIITGLLAGYDALTLSEEDARRRLAAFEQSPWRRTRRWLSSRLRRR